jgi:hypothetical protein
LRERRINIMAYRLMWRRVARLEDRIDELEARLASDCRQVHPTPERLLDQIRCNVSAHEPTIESTYGCSVDELQAPPPGWRYKELPGGRWEFRVPSAGRGDWFMSVYSRVRDGRWVISASDHCPTGPRLILERITDRPRRWVLEETGETRVPKGGEWSYMNGLPHYWRDDATMSYEMLRQVETPWKQPTGLEPRD